MRERQVRGATAIEYALLVALLAVVIIGSLTSVGIGVSRTFDLVALSAAPLGSSAGGGVGAGASGGGGFGGGASGGSGLGGSVFGP